MLAPKMTPALTVVPVPVAGEVEAAAVAGKNSALHHPHHCRGLSLETVYSKYYVVHKHTNTIKHYSDFQHYY